jgi:hypothetical protein
VIRGLLPLQLGVALVSVNAPGNAANRLVGITMRARRTNITRQEDIFITFSYEYFVFPRVA